ncbi:hypothetical protein A374_03934 [Fictibacillus macauensis ZFHKF-1]|uniref:NADH dehydrogenase subunit n n=1 Tax=Fictibacillus macauensis ZFHKF-1 TaxID=1196324 RepID=I8J4I8_9BACL|nr:hypothetical protein [Fictibacillus macauensis]EIT86691.1 hypothetical protein A374_03934 [Fictibacillus macauensis ZFHKF-1]
MLSQQSHQFLLELRLYLVQRGKKDQDINSIVEELETHLLQAEQNGDDVKEIIGKSRKHHMQHISKELPFDTKGMITFLPAVVLLLIAYMSFPAALLGHFSLSHNLLIFGSLLVILSLALFTFAFFKGVIKSSLWFITLTFLSQIVTTSLWVAFYIWLRHQPDSTYFVATPLQNVGIVIGCIIIFIASALYSKSWISIIIPFVISIIPITEAVLPARLNKDPLMVISLLLLVVVGAYLLFYMLKKKEKHE